MLATLEQVDTGVGPETASGDRSLEFIVMDLGSELDSDRRGNDPKVVLIGIELARHRIKNGTRQFLDFAECVRERTAGDWGKVKSRLYGFWSGACSLPEFKAIHDELEDLTRLEADRQVRMIELEGYARTAKGIIGAVGVHAAQEIVRSVFSSSRGKRRSASPRRPADGELDLSEAGPLSEDPPGPAHGTAPSDASSTAGRSTEPLNEVLRREVEMLPLHVCRALWLQTSSDVAWTAEPGAESIPESAIADIVEYLRGDSGSCCYVKGEAIRVAKSIARKARIALQKITDYRVFGDDSVLENTWEEICVQVQDQESFAWHVYVETINATMGYDVEVLDQCVQEALWLQTKQGNDWVVQNEGTDPPPVCIDDIVDYIRQDHLLAEADSWSNPRIRAYLDARYQPD